MVLISTEWVDIPMTLSEWIQMGPGRKVLRSPYRIWNLLTGDEMSVEDLPLPYRNSYESIEKIVAGELEDPWKRDLEALKTAL